MLIRQLKQFRINLNIFLTGCTADFYGLNCSQSCSCTKMHQSRPCDAVTGHCYCLANYTGQNCELPQNTTEMMANPTGIIVANPTGIIAGALVGSTATVLIIVAVAVLLLFIFDKNILLCNWTRRVSPSPQSKASEAPNQDIKQSETSEAQNQDIKQSETSEAQNQGIKLEDPMSPPPPYDQIQQFIPVTTETSSSIL